MFKKNLYNGVAQIEIHGTILAVDPILKKGLVGAVVVDLRERVTNGELSGLLPGVRLLAKALGVSVPTVCKALHLLEEEGILTGSGGRRRWRASNSHGGTELGKKPSQKRIATSKRSPRSGRLLFLASMQLSSERHSGVEVFAELLDQLGASGWEVMHRVENFGSSKNPRKSWDELLKLTKPDAMVVLGGTPSLGMWAASRKLRTLFLGGDAGDSGVPVLAVKVATMLKYALERLLSQGHRKILIPLCCRPKAFVGRCHTAATEIAAEANQPRDRIVIAETAYARPEVMVGLLRKQWRKQAPDALILLDSRELLAADGFFREMGIEIPRDLSVVILSQNSILDWHQPTITHFEHPVKLMARTIARWVTHGRPSFDLEAITEVRARWVEGKSVMARN
jgi:DNA-binding LacI/PurR family transcriptional regulator